MTEPYSNYNDEQLISLIKLDDARAFQVLYDRYWEQMYKSAFYLLRDHTACTDIVQDIFIWIWEKRSQYDFQLTPSYLRAAVRFKVANYIKSGKIRHSFYAELAALPPGDEAGPEDILELNDLKALINFAVNSLPYRCREIFMLSRDGHLSNQQIADKLGISIKTVEAQKTIALKRIRLVVEPYLLSILLFPTLYNVH